MKNSLGYKIGLAIFVIASVTIIIGIFSYFMHERTILLFEETVTSRLPLMTISSAARTDLSRMAVSMQTYMVLGDKEYINDYQTYEQNFAQDLDNLAQLQTSLDPQSQQQLQDLRQTFATWQEIPEELFVLRENQMMREPAYAWLNTTGAVYTKDILTAIHGMQKIQLMLPPTPQTIQVLYDMAKFQQSFLETFSSVRTYVMTQDPNTRFYEYETNYATNQEDWSALLRHQQTFTAEQQHLFALIKRNRAALFTLIPNQVFAVMDSEHWRKDLFLYKSQAAPLVQHMHTTLDAIVYHQQQLIRNELNLSNQRLQETRWGIIGTTFLILVLSVGIAFGLNRHIIPPIERLTKVAYMIQQGNLDVTAPVQTNDEIGTFAQTFNEMTSRLRATIEQQYQTQKALQESKHNLQTLFDTVEDFLFVVDRQGYLLLVNTFFLKRLDYTLEEITGMHILNLRHPTRVAEAIANSNNTLAGISFTCNVPLMTRHGEQIEVETRVAPGRWDDREVFFGISHDITERLAAEQKIRSINEQLAQINAELEQRVQDRTAALETANYQLASSRKALYTLIDGLKDGLMLLDHQGIILAVNQTFAYLMDTNSDSLANHHWYHVCMRSLEKHPGTSTRALCSLQTMPLGTHHLTYLDSDGQNHLLDIHILSLLDADMATQTQNEPMYGSIMHVVDVTQRFQMETRLVQNERYAATGRIAATVAHEVNTPLQAIEGLCYIISTADKVEQDSCLEQIRQEVSRVGRILHQLATHSVPNTDVLMWVQPHEVINDILLLTSGIMARHLVSVKREFAENIPPIYCQKDHLKQIILNLVINAIDAMSKGGRMVVSTHLVTKEVCTLTPNVLSQHIGINDMLPITTTNGDVSPMFAIVIEDTGKGIEPSLLQRIFEPFFTTKENDEGSGIGLAITQQIIKRYGGTIHVFSELNVGTTFTVLFPIDSPLIKQHTANSLVFG